MEKILKTYLRRLTNLTSRNRSLLLLNLPQEQFFDLHGLDFINSKPSFDLLSQLIAQKPQIILCDVLDARFEKNNEASKKLRKIDKTEARIEEERGANDLYVGYPFIKGKFADGTVIRCPLLFFPVTISQKNNKWILEKRDENISFNRSFLLAYSHFNQVKMADEWLENSFEDFDKDALVFRTQLYELLKNSPFQINFNQDLFQNQITDYQTLTKTYLEQNERNGELKLYPNAVLGIFPQGGSFLVNDYKEIIEKEVQKSKTKSINEDEKKIESLEDLFKKSAPFINHSTLNEASTFLPFAIDSSQEEAVKIIKNGQSLVVQGPPGTGKSQLICNLISDFTARGKRVLVVCQKRVALDTVFNRLASIRMTDFVGLVHDFKNDRKLLFEKIANQIEKIEDYKKKNQSLDSIFLDRNFTQNSRRIDQICNELQDFKNALFDESETGLSVKELYLTSNPNEANIDLNELYKWFNFNDLASFEQKLKAYFEYEENFNFDGNLFWKNRASFHQFNFQQKREIEKCISEIVDYQAFTKNETSKTIGTHLGFAELLDFDEKRFENFIENIENEDVLVIFGAIVNEKKYLIRKSDGIEKILQKLSIIYDNAGVEKYIPTYELELRKVQTEKALKSAENWVELTAWKVFSKDSKDVKSTLLFNDLKLQKADLQLLLQKIMNRIYFEKVSEKVREIGILIDAKQSGTDVVQTLKNYILANVAFKDFKELTAIKESDLAMQKSLADFEKKTIFLQNKIKEAKEKNNIWKNWFTAFQLNKIIDDNFNKELIINYLNTYFELFHEQDIIRESFTKTEWKVIEKLISQQVDQPKENQMMVFQNSLRLAWIEHLENKHPILRGVSSLKIKQLEEELQVCIKKKQELSQEIVLLKLREESYKDLKINRLQNITTYRELLHQVSKKRKIWSVRKVIETYTDEIFKLIPCWMASPESVSAIFNLDNPILEGTIFDLVIFDEASQCYAENGIPSIFRGQQVVIAGDSKQLQPNDLYQIRYEEDVSDEPILEIDSLLDLATQYLPQTQLKGHYRSHSLDLIDFSNHYFYKNTLRLLPHYQEINQKNPSINYIKVDGIWENNSNTVEAQKVIEIINDLQKKHPKKSIGIVTFNFKQADLIESQIINLTANTFINEPQTSNFKSQISIKNIENIQGDEFDFVIFSVAYAPDEKGKMLMNFGSFNQKGGENRLNVAITRAKEKIFVISSILPSQLRVEDSQNEGPKLLKKYLAYALEVSEGKYTPKPNSVEKYHADWLLKNQIIRQKTKQISLNLELPFADITVKKYNQYESLILTDDDLYYENPPKESHAYLPMNLQEKGWKFERIWSRNFRKEK